ncbi:MAG: T9SS type A sorting domain-containing protein [Bacteroidota bacterium]
MKRTLLFICFVAFTMNALAQFQVGHRSITYTDPARSNRSIATEIYYPATTAGDNVAFATGQFPLIVFGHGFVMSYSLYDYIWNALTPLGYIVACPNTETSTSPVHADFGADLAFLINKLKSENTNSSSPFYQKLTNKSAVMGHSMGGGSAFLACAGNSVPDAMVTLAAAETTPSSITAAATVTTPNLVISGSDDCTAPAATHQTPMYNALASSCKVFISIINGSHCYFGNYSFLCTAAESFCLPVPSLSRAAQQTTTMNFVKPYLDYFLKGNVASWNYFVDSLSASSNITFINNCPINPTSVDKQQGNATFDLYPNPSIDYVTVSLSAIPAEGTLQLVDITGRPIASKTISESAMSLESSFNINNLASGLYFIKLNSKNTTLKTQRFIKL